MAPKHMVLCYLSCAQPRGTNPTPTKAARSSHWLQWVEDSPGAAPRQGWQCWDGPNQTTICESREYFICPCAQTKLSFESPSLEELKERQEKPTWKALLHLLPKAQALYISPTFFSIRPQQIPKPWGHFFLSTIKGKQQVLCNLTGFK